MTVTPLLAAPSQRLLAPPPPSARFLTFSLGADVEPARVAEALARLAATPHDPAVIVAVGAPTAARLGRAVPGLRPFPTDQPLFPSTQAALWAVVGHADPGARLDAGVALAHALRPAFAVVEEIDAFMYRGGRDLSGYEDGTENPQDDEAVAAAIIAGRGHGLDGGSFVAVQRWVHDLDAVARMSPAARDHMVGRRLEDNAEIVDAPPSAHVKRAAQESFDPPAFMVRRSMPWGGAREHGLYFVAYVEDLDRFERVLLRMSGREDGIVDGLLGFSRAVTGGYFFVPPLTSSTDAEKTGAGRLDLRALGL